LSPARLVTAALACVLLGFAPAYAATVQAAANRAPTSSKASELASVTPTPLVSQHAYVKAASPDGSDNFGRSVSISGDTLVVGAPGEDSESTGVNSTPNEAAANSGAAFVYVRVDGVWSQQAYLKASTVDDLGGDNFGNAVAISGDTIVVGAELEDSASASNEADNTANDSGAAYVFTRTDGTWTQQAYLKPAVIDATGADRFGSAVAIDGDTIIVGARFEDSNGSGPTNNGMSNSGAAYVFVRNAGVWSQQAYIKASNPDSTNDNFGENVAIDGETALIAASNEDGNGTAQSDNSASGAGAVYVFTRTGAVWAQQAYLKASNVAQGDGFGSGVALSGDSALVGAVSEDSSATGANGDQADNSFQQAGAAYVFLRTGSTWAQQAYLKASNTGPSYQFGHSVALDGDLALIGSPNESSDSVGINRPSLNEDAPISGAAYIYRRNGTTWTLTDYLKQSNTDEDDLLGSRVAVSGTLLVGTAQGEASTVGGVNGNQADDSAPFAGAAYVFGPPCATPPFTDVATDQAFCAEIEWMKQSAISTGFNDGTYRPADPVTRQAMSAFLARLADASLTSCTVPPFSDVPTSHPFCSEIQWMKDAAVSIGFNSGCGTFTPPCYLPGANVTRQAMSAFMSRVAGGSPPACVSPPFSDVPTSHTFCTEIRWMKDNGISTGFASGCGAFSPPCYLPGANVTRQAMSAFIFRLNDLLYHF
jgi:FG-GAP repeat/S-layer homology domain